MQKMKSKIIKSKKKKKTVPEHSSVFPKISVKWLQGECSIGVVYSLHMIQELNTIFTSMDTSLFKYILTSHYLLGACSS